MSTPDPPDPPDFDLARLKAGLRAAGLDDVFQTIECTHVGRFSNDVWRLALDNGLRLIAKAPYRAPRPDEDPDVEARFYQLMAGRRELPIPRFVGRFAGALVLEHLELHDFSFRQGVGGAHADAAIDALADWHAVFWQQPPQAPWLADFADPLVRGTIQANYDRAWATHARRLLEYAPEFAAIGNALVGRLADTLLPMAEPATLIHGDAHAENVPMTDQGALILDWQDPRISNPGLDLAVFTTMSYPEEQRRKHEQYLVDRHAQRLREHGCTWPDPWQAYRLGLLRRAARIVEIATADFISLPWVFRRSALAAVEHQVEDLIR